ncbi:MAG: mobile mystery protein B [Gemmatimonadaceae bacterium]|nr:mobile mystery protein B [Gemmatimonadaceae bacterium]
MPPVPEGTTPLDPDEAADLIPDHLMTTADLNDWEATNIVHAQEWALGRKHPDVATEHFVKSLHLRMFDETWTWAGKYRVSEKSIGSSPQLIAPQVRDACANAAFWVKQRIFEPTELAVRFHHRMVAVHPFPNGNGRHARLLADALLYSLGVDLLTWGSQGLQATGEVRRTYIDALRSADNGDLSGLMRLARA